MVGTAKHRPDSVTVIAIYHFVEAALLLFGVLGVGIGFLVLAIGAPGGPGTGIAYGVMGVVGALLLLATAADVVAGIGLLNLKDWARWVAIVLSVLRLPGVPVGTAIGGLTIYFLLQDDVKSAFATD